jgi:putative modified peptide
MANSKGKGPHPLNPAMTKKLLDHLTSDDAFRQHFQTDAKAALESIGYQAPTDDTAHLGECLQLKAGATLASPESITADRAKLQQSLGMIQGFLCPTELQQ